jgi:hypothetical protein
VILETRWEAAFVREQRRPLCERRVRKSKELPIIYVDVRGETAWNLSGQPFDPGFSHDADVKGGLI